MTEGEQGKMQDPLVAAIPDDVAADLPTLMMRLERSRKFFYAEREYIKLILMGAAFVLAGLLASPEMPRRTFIVLTFFATPWLFGWYNLPARRLANVFRNETMPFLLRHFGRWNYALDGQHFAKKALKETGLVEPTDLIGVSDIITGERYGVPMQLALTTAWTPHRFGIYRPAKPNFGGWSVSMRLASMPAMPLLILPQDQRPLGAVRQSWVVASQIAPGYQLWCAPEHKEPALHALPVDLATRLVGVMVGYSGVRIAFTGEMMWVLVPGQLNAFNGVKNLTDRLDDPSLYDNARQNLSAMFTVVDKLVWPA